MKIISSKSEKTALGTTDGVLNMMWKQNRLGADDVSHGTYLSNLEIQHVSHL